jgi:hypothetical protein
MRKTTRLAPSNGLDFVPGLRAAGACGLLLGMILVSGSTAQQPVPGNALPQPRLFVATPNGGKAGTTVEVTLTGQDLEEPQTLLFSHPGLKAELVPPPPPPAPDPKQPDKKPMAPPPAVKFKITIDPGAPLGTHDVRLVSKWGVSNSRAFVVGDLTEVAEKEPNNDVPQAQRVDLNGTVTGAVTAPTDVDYFVFAGKKGQRVVVSCLASSIDSRLQAGLELYDSAGRQLALNRNYLGTDALVDSTLPADGDYHVRLFEFTHTSGSAEHFYRLSISTAPWIDAIFPPVVELGKPAQLTLYGRNLPGGTPDPTAVVNGRVLEKASVTINVPSDPQAAQRIAFTGRVPPTSSGLDGFEYRVKNEAGTSNPYLLTYARAPVVVEKEENQTAETAQEISLPCELAGRIEKRRDRDWYTFTAKKGETYNFELLSDRLGCQTDMYFVLRKLDSKQQLGEFDDNADTLSPFKFFTRTDDPATYRFTAPADGKYHLLVSSRDADVRAGPRLLYRVRITPEQPDFRLVVIDADDQRPDACVVPQGGHQHLAVLIWRLDGWNGEVALTVEGLPPGVTCPPQVLAKGMKHTALVLSAAADAPPWAGEIRVKGTATVNGQTVVREARPASITWPIQQPNIQTISRLDRSLVLAVRDKPPFSVATSVDKTAVTQGSKATATLKVARLWPDFKAALQVTAIDLPANLTFNNNQPLQVAADKNEATGVFDVRPNVAPGTYNLVLRSSAQIAYNKDPMAKQKPNINVVYATTPVTLTVYPQQVATLSLGAPEITLKLAAQAEVVVKVARTNDYAGEFKVELVLPDAVKGVSSESVTIPAGQKEGKLIVRAAADAPPGKHANLVVKAVAMLAPNLPATHETKLTINVVK